MSKKMVSIAMFALLTVIMLAPLIPPAEATNDPPDNGGVNNVTGDWIVDSDRSYVNSTTIHMLDGNVTVKSGFTLTLDHSILDFAPTSDGSQGIFVEGGATLNLRGNALITSTNLNSYNCVFYQGSNINVTGARIYSAGGMVPNTTIAAGIYVGTGKAVFDGAIFISHLDSANILRLDGKGVIIRNSSFQSASNYAIEAYADFDVYDSTFSRIGGSTNYDGIFSFGANTTLLNNRLSVFDVGLALFGGKHQIDGNKVDNNTQGMLTDGNAVITMKGNEINNNANNGMTVRYATLTMKGNNIHRNQRGMDLNTVNLESKDDVLFDNTNENMVLMSSSVNMTHLTYTKTTAGSGVTGGYGSNLMIQDSTMTQPNANSMISLMFGNTIELRNDTIKVSDVCVLVAYSSKLTLVNNNISSLSGGSSPLVVAIENSDIASSHNGYNDHNTGIVIQNHGKLTSYDDTFTTAVPNAEAFLAISFANIEAHNTKATLGATGSLGQIMQADATFFDCTLETTASTRMYEALSYAHVLSVSSSPDIDNVTSVMGGTVDIAWWTEVLTRWQNQAPAANATVYFNDTRGVNFIDMDTGLDGTGKAIVISDTRMDTGILHHNDYRVAALKNGTKVTRTLNISNDLVGGNRIVLQLTDDTAPVISILNPASDLITNKAHIIMNGTASDSGSGLAKVEVNNGTGWVLADGLENWGLDTNLTDGNLNLDARATDVSGRIANVSVNIIVDLTDPTLEVSTPSGLYVTVNEFNLTGLTEAGADVVIDGAPANMDGIHFSKVMNLPDGPHDIVINATDVAGNTFGIVKHVIVDTIAPTLTTDIENGGWVNVTSYLFAGKSDGDYITVAGANATLDTANGTFSALITLVDGANNVTVIATDLAGNENRSDIVVNVDRIPPVLNVTYPEADALGIIYINSNELIVRGVVEGADLLFLEGTPVTIGDNGTFTANMTIEEEISEVTLIAKDLAGNTDSWTHTVIKDTVEPVITITSPAQGFATNQATVTVSGRVDDRTAALSSGDTTVTNDNGVFSFEATLSDGTNEVMVTARDLAENIGTASVTVVLDTAAELAVTSLTENETSTKGDTFKFEGTSEPGSKVYINDALVSKPDGTFSYEWPLQDGENKIIVRTVDPAGNEKTQTYTITKTVEAPSAMSMSTGAIVLAIVLLVIGLVVGLVAGKAMTKPKGPAPKDEPYYPPKPERVETPRRAEVPAREERRFPERPPKEEPKPEPAPAPAQPARAEIREAPRPPEPKPEPRPEPKKASHDEDLDDLLSRLK